jgi:hypothetical protein
MSDSKIIFITVVRNHAMYDKYVRLNENCKDATFVFFDNNIRNKSIPFHYNNFLDSYDYSNDAWFVFCHEDFEFLENPRRILHGLDANVLYGPIGHIRVGLLGFGVQRARGEVRVTKKGEDTLKSWKIGRRLTKPAKVETFDCCCLMVHSSLVKRLKLRFDEKLEFDMYVEDFCAMAHQRGKVSSYAVQMDVCHHSDAVATERLWRHLPYLAEKYNTHCYTGTLTYFGMPSWQKQLQDFLVALIRRVFCKKDKNRTNF